MQELFPGEFDQLVRVYNHKKVDQLLEKHDDTHTKRDSCVAALGRACRARHAAHLAEASAAAASAPAKGKGGDLDPEAAVGRGLTKRVRNAELRVEALKLELDGWEQQILDLEVQIKTEQEEALSKPLGTAFIALFK